MTEIKQVIVMRKDLKMRKGKMIAQGAHASMAFLVNHGDGITNTWAGDQTVMLTPLTPVQEIWIREDFTKICVSVDSEDGLFDILDDAERVGLLVKIIRDKGLTEFGGVPTYTCLAIGPDYADKIDEITGHLPLL